MEKKGFSIARKKELYSFHESKFDPASVKLQEWHEDARTWLGIDGEMENLKNGKVREYLNKAIKELAKHNITMEFMLPEDLPETLIVFEE